MEQPTKTAVLAAEWHEIVHEVRNLMSEAVGARQSAFSLLIRQIEGR